MNNTRKPILGFEGLYEFDGKSVISLPRKMWNGVGFFISKEKSLKPHKNPAGYLDVQLRLNGKTRAKSLHRLVWEYYNGLIPNGLEINHKNGIKTDNNIENLETVTPKENQHHRIHVLGKSNRGENHGGCKLKDCDIIEIKKLLLDDNKSKKEIIEKFKISKSYLWAIETGKKRAITI